MGFLEEEALKKEADWLYAAAAGARHNSESLFTDEYLKGFEAAADWVRFHSMSFEEQHAKMMEMVETHKPENIGLFINKEGGDGVSTLD